VTAYCREDSENNHVNIFNEETIAQCKTMIAFTFR